VTSCVEPALSGGAQCSRVATRHPQEVMTVNTGYARLRRS
jgi:hypothetical protein